MSEETVWTSRRASLRSAGSGWAPGRLRVSDRAVRFTGADGAVVEVLRAEIVSARVARRALVVETATGSLRLRCFAMPAIAALLRR